MCRDNPRAHDPAATRSRGRCARLPVPCENLPPLFPSAPSPVRVRLCLWQSWSSRNCLRQFYLCCCDDRAHPLAQHHAFQVSRHVHIEHDDRHLVVHAQRDGRRVHHHQTLFQHVQISNVLEHLSARHFFRISIVNSIRSRGFQDRLRLDFHRAKCCGGVGRKIGIPCSGGKNHHAPFFQMTSI